MDNHNKSNKNKLENKKSKRNKNKKTNKKSNLNQNKKTNKKPNKNIDHRPVRFNPNPTNSEIFNS